MSPADRREELLPVVDAAQRAAGILAARHRGDREGARLLVSEMSSEDLAGGALLLAELTLSLYADASGDDVERCLRDLASDLEHAVRTA
jgi:Fe-Mn family superoxide dismutase